MLIWSSGDQGSFKKSGVMSLILIQLIELISKDTLGSSIYFAAPIKSQRGSILVPPPGDIWNYNSNMRENLKL